MGEAVNTTSSYSRPVRASFKRPRGTPFLEFEDEAAALPRNSRYKMAQANPDGRQPPSPHSPAQTAVLKMVPRLMSSLLVFVSTVALLQGRQATDDSLALLLHHLPATTPTACSLIVLPGVPWHVCPC